MAVAVVALLVGARPRTKGMERKDLLEANGAIFTVQGKALSDNAAADVKVLVVGNPANTNALIAMHNAPNIPHERFTAMTRLDQNRAKAQLAAKSGRPVSEVTNMTIWGNHSATQYPDAKNARIGGRPAPEVIKDAAWLGGDFITTVQKRGAAVIEMRGLSSAGSAANAAIDSVVSIRTPTARGDWHSLAVVSRGEYGTPEGLQFGFPVASDGAGWKVVEGLQHDADAQQRIKATTEELLQERELVRALVPA